jgi:hypothetical protein
MPHDDRAQQAAGDGAATDAKPACRALVQLVETAQWLKPNQQPTPANAIFVTHLIATREQAPQTRSLRRATASDADTAYKANQHRVEGTGNSRLKHDPEKWTPVFRKDHA